MTIEELLGINKMAIVINNLTERKRLYYLDGYYMVNYVYSSRAIIETKYLSEALEEFLKEEE
jgi:hypothetical protein